MTIRLLADKAPDWNIQLAGSTYVIELRGCRYHCKTLRTDTPLDNLRRLRLYLNSEIINSDQSLRETAIIFSTIPRYDLMSSLIIIELPLSEVDLTSLRRRIQRAGLLLDNMLRKSADEKVVFSSYVFIVYSIHTA
jgi:hypothetical protein